MPTTNTRSSNNEINNNNNKNNNYNNNNESMQPKCEVSTTSNATTANAAAASSSSSSVPPMVTVAKSAIFHDKNSGATVNTATATATPATTITTTIMKSTKIVGVSSTASSMEQRRQSKTANIKLINLVRRRPWLYDGSHPNYAKKHLIEKTWTQIGRSCSETGAICKERWRNIRAAFARSINIYKTQSGPNRLKPYYLHRELQFLINPMTKGRKSQTKLEDSSAEEEASCEEQEEHDVNEHDKAEILMDLDADEDVDENEDEDEDEAKREREEEDKGATKKPNNSTSAKYSNSREFTEEETAVNNSRLTERFTDTETDAIMEDNSNFSFFGDITERNRNELLSQHQHHHQQQQMTRLKKDRFENIPDDADLLFVKSLYYDMSGLDDSQKRRLKMNIYEALEQVCTTTTTTSTAASTTAPVVRQSISSVMCSLPQAQPNSAIPKVAAQSSSSSSSTTTTTTQVPLTPTQKQSLILLRNLDETKLQQLNRFVQHVLAPPTNESPTSSITANVIGPSATEAVTANGNLTYSFTVKEESLDDLASMLTLPSH